MTLSAGVAAAGVGADGHRLLDRADRALRRAKLAGRDRVVRSSTIDERQDREDQATVSARRAALAIASPRWTRATPPPATTPTRW